MDSCPGNLNLIEDDFEIILLETACVEFHANKFVLRVLLIPLILNCVRLVNQGLLMTHTLY